jgi:hypothetical protein
MAESRWLRWIGPGGVALGAAALIASTTFGAGSTTFGAGTKSWGPRACAGPPGEAIAAARQPAPATPANMRDGAWYRLDPVLNAEGALRGQRLAVGVGDRRAEPAADLPPESFAGGPFGRIVLVGSDDGSTSRLDAFDVAGGCTWTLATEHDVIRRATVDPAGATIYETRVDRTSRADLGVWQRRLDGGPARRILEPLPADARFGRTFATEFTWAADDERLAVQACGEVACRTRIVARDGSLAGDLEASDLGVLVGFAGDRAVTYGACRGWPCPIVSVDVRTGTRLTLDASGGGAVVVPTSDGARLVLETWGATGRRLRSMSLDGAAGSDLGPVPDGLGIGFGPGRSTAATRLPDGWILLGPDPASPGRQAIRGQLRRVPDGMTVPFDEAMR